VLDYVRMGKTWKYSDLLHQSQISALHGTCRHEQGLSISGRTHSNSQTARKLKHHIMLDTSR